MLEPLPENPKISVISTVYQHERFVARALESVLAQDWPREQLQYVIVNDGSTDGSREILDDYAARHPFIRVIHQENGGLKAAINRAMSEVDGDLIRPLSGDDMLPPGALRVAAEHMIANPGIGLLYSDMTIIDDEDRVTAPSFMAFNDKKPFVGRPLGELLSANFVSSGSVMLRGALRDHVHPLPDEAAWEDYWWAWRVAQVADLDFLDTSTYLYRSHGSNMSFGVSGAKQAHAFKEEIRFRRHMLSCVEPGQVSSVWAMRGYGQLLRMATIVTEQLRESPETVMPVTPEQRADAEIEAAEALGAAGHGDMALASVHCVRALGRDPHRDDMRQLSRHLHAAVRDGADAPSATDAVEELLRDMRGFVTIADADELVAQPELLRVYGETISAADDATLLIHAAGWPGERAGRELGGLLDRYEITADVLAHPGPASDRPALLRHAHAVLSARDGVMPPHFGVADAAALRARAERRWAVGDQAAA